MGRQSARVLVTPELLKSFLRLPDNTDVRHMGYEFDTDCLSIIIGHPALPDCEEGTVVPRILPTCQYNPDGSTTVEWPDLQTEVSV